MSEHGPERLAISDIPCRDLPYLRTGAVGDIRMVADLYGADLLNEAPDAHWLDIDEARKFLAGVDTSLWRCLDKDRAFNSLSLNTIVHFLEIFAGCGHLSLAIAQSGLRVGPGIDKGYGKANAVVLDIRKASDHRMVWALDAILAPVWIHLGIPCT